MQCEACDDGMQRETVVVVMRVRGRLRSVAQPGWYCWTCRTSRHSASDLFHAEPPPGARSLVGRAAARVASQVASQVAGRIVAPSGSIGRTHAETGRSPD